MSIKLTGEQWKIVKGTMEIAQAFADQILHIMKNHGLDKIEGCNFTLMVDPALTFSTEDIRIGSTVESDFGRITMSKGLIDKKFVPVGQNSPEYELLFAEEPLRAKMMEILSIHDEKPLPQDGLWVGKDYEGE